jgi:ABC-type thiamin/hydroxymethylpyrimidine transport system permease subunit
LFVQKSELATNHVLADFYFFSPNIFFNYETFYYLTSTTNFALVLIVVSLSSFCRLAQLLSRCLQTADPSQHCLTRDDLSDTNTPLDITDTVINKLPGGRQR